MSKKQDFGISATDVGFIDPSKTIGFFAAFFALVVFAFGCWDDMRVPIFWCIVITSLTLLIHVRRNPILFVIAFVMLYANYSAAMVNVFVPYTGYDTAYVKSPFSAEALLVVLLFTSLLLVLLPFKIAEPSKLNFFDRVPRFPYRVASTLAVCVLLIVIFFTQSSGFSDTGGRAESSSIFEYGYIIILAGYLLAGKSKGCRIAITVLAFLYIAQPLFGGNRANMLNVVLLLFIIFYSDRLDWKNLLPILLLGTLFMVSIGYFRSGGDFSPFAIILRMGDAFNRSMGNNFVWDTASYAFHQCIAFLDLRDGLGNGEYLYLLGQWIKSWFLGSSMIPDSMLSYYVQAHLSTGLGGGFLPVYFYFYLGIPGIIVSAGITAFWMRMICGVSKQTLLFPLLACIAFGATVCRWYLYSPAPLTSGLIFLLLVCIFLSLFVKGFFSSSEEENHVRAIHPE